MGKTLQIEAGQDLGNTIRDNATLALVGAITPYFRRLRNLLLTNPVMTWLGLLPMGAAYHKCIKAIDERHKDPDARFDLVAHWFRTMKQSPERLNLKVGPSSAPVPGVSCPLRRPLFARSPSALPFLPGCPSAHHQRNDPRC